eukprot:gene4795-5422_t
MSLSTVQHSVGLNANFFLGNLDWVDQSCRCQGVLAGERKIPSCCWPLSLTLCNLVEAELMLIGSTEDASALLRDEGIIGRWKRSRGASEGFQTLAPAKYYVSNKAFISARKRRIADKATVYISHKLPIVGALNKLLACVHANDTRKNRCHDVIEINLVNGSGYFILKLGTFYNTGDNLWDNSDCEGWGGTCDNMFEICVKQFPPLPLGMGSCLYYKKATQQVEATSVNFQSDSTGISRSIRINVNRYTGSGFFMRIMDHDSASSSDHVDDHAFGETFTPGVNGNAIDYWRRNYGRRSRSKTTLTFTVSVGCDQYYYSSTCERYCKPQNDASGHYSCSSHGMRICLTDWFVLPDCLVYCRPHDDDTNGHYTCDNRGNHVCRTNWFNLPLCTTLCEPHDDSTNGHYTCDSTGVHVCRAGWYNQPKCLTYCMPQDDDINGHYTCASNGSRVCRTGWHSEPDCLTYCVPQNDDINGHYTCASNGSRICRPGWFVEPDCTRFCEPKDSVEGHYTCDGSGNRVCRKNWHGLPNCTTFCEQKTVANASNANCQTNHTCLSNGTCLNNGSNACVEETKRVLDNKTCDVYCEPRHDEFAHFDCSNNGSRICRQNWYNLPNCTTFCEEKDDADGHYECTQNGTRVCSAYWYGLPNCTTHCKPQNDALLGHYTCSFNGTRQCNANWYNLPNCTTFCEQHDDDVNGHYTCTGNGSRVCLENWYNLPNCTQFCRPTNDSSTEHYTCDRQGQIVCHDGWFSRGNDKDFCTEYCVPASSNASGYYNCSARGDKICHADWYGSDCQKHCKVASQNSTYLKCNSTGSLVCRQNYYGNNCRVYCVPQDDPLHGHFNCEVNSGRRLCLPGWTGDYCNVTRTSIAQSLHTNIRTNGNSITVLRTQGLSHATPGSLPTANTNILTLSSTTRGLHLPTTTFPSGSRLLTSVLVTAKSTLLIKHGLSSSSIQTRSLVSFSASNYFHLKSQSHEILSRVKSSINDAAIKPTVSLPLMSQSTVSSKVESSNADTDASTTINSQTSYHSSSIIIKNTRSCSTCFQSPQSAYSQSSFDGQSKSFANYKLDTSSLYTSHPMPSATNSRQVKMSASTEKTATTSSTKRDFQDASYRSIPSKGRVTPSLSLPQSVATSSIFTDIQATSSNDALRTSVFTLVSSSTQAAFYTSNSSSAIASSVFNSTLTPTTTLETKEDKTSVLDWLSGTDEGKTILAGSAIALLLIILLIAAIISYLRPVKPQKSKIIPFSNLEMAKKLSSNDSINDSFPSKQENTTGNSARRDNRFYTNKLYEMHTIDKATMRGAGGSSNPWIFDRQRDSDSDEDIIPSPSTPDVNYDKLVARTRTNVEAKRKVTVVPSGKVKPLKDKALDLARPVADSYYSLLYSVQNINANNCKLFKCPVDLALRIKRLSCNAFSLSVEQVSRRMSRKLHWPGLREVVFSWGRKSMLTT